MRVVIIFLLLIVLGFVGWKLAERYKLLETPVETQPPAVLEDEAAETPTDQEADVAKLPSFDIVRVDRSGDAVIAGRAEPGAEVTVIANGEPLASETAGPDGAWVIVTETPLAAGTVELGLEMTTSEGLTIRSDETIVIYVPERPGDKPLVLRTTPGGATEVLQDPRDPSPALGPLALEAIDYDDSGTVIFSGRAEPGRAVQMFISGALVSEANPDGKAFLGETAAGAGGRWSLTAPNIAPGIYTLYVIQLDEERRPAYALELPFERARPEDIDLRDGNVVVQPGNSLWRIARRVYGSGFQYTIIYAANADQIRDPDLIYPGQILALPEEEEASESDGEDD